MILSGGENLIDFIELPGEDGLPLFRAVPGGSPYNTAKAMARLGLRVGYLTPLSQDALGTLLAEGLEAEGVALLAPRSARPTCLALVTVRDGIPSYQFYREGTADRDVTLAGLLADAPAEARGFVLGSMALADGPDAEAWADLFVRLHDRGLVTCFDPNLRPRMVRDAAAYRARLDRVFAAADLVKLSDEDLAWLAPDVPLDAAASALFDRARPGVLAVTRGAAGALGFCGAGRIEVPAAPLPRLVDTVGAGDTFMAALVADLDARGRLSRPDLATLGVADLTEVLGFAARAAAVTCSREGCDPPSRAELGS